MRTLAALLLVGCEAGGDLPPGQSPPPMAMRIYVGSVVEGGTLLAEIFDAHPGDPIRVAYSAQGLGSGPCLPAFGGLCLDIVQPQLLATLTADASGHATHTVHLPAHIPASQVAFQAVGGMGAGAYKSDTNLRPVLSYPPVPLQLCDPTTMAADPYTQAGASIDGDILSLDVEFSGGCAPHTFTPCWNGMFALSLPVQATVSVMHDAHGDMCRAWLMQTRTFDLAPMRAAYGWSTPAEIVVHVGADTVRYDIP